MTRRLALPLAAVAGLLAARGASAGPYTDDLGKCLVGSTTKADRETLVRWFFTAAALNPAVKSIVVVSKGQVDAANKATGELFMRLLTVTCKAETQKAFHYEGGGAAVGAGFEMLGKVAGRELFAAPEVAESLNGLTQHLDEKKLKELGEPPPGK